VPQVHCVSAADASSPEGLVVPAGQAWQLFPATRSSVPHVMVAQAVFTPAARLSPAGRLFPAGQSKHAKVLPPTTNVSTNEFAGQVQMVLPVASSPQVQTVSPPVASSPTPATNGLMVFAGQAAQAWLATYSSSAHTAGLQQVAVSQAQPVPSQLTAVPLLRLASLQPAKLSQAVGVQSCVQHVASSIPAMVAEPDLMV
jgi:hypothetical protein